MEHREKAEELFKSGCNCAQSVFAAFCDVTGIPFETALKLSASFGGGMGKLREMCGACSGAFMAAGMLWGGYDVKDNAAKAGHYAVVRRIAEEFKAINSSYNCGELLKDVPGTEGNEPAERTPEYYATRPCCRFIGDAAEILDKIIEERGL